eukprot:6838665-Alexandrium_andersonii.AAC.1
MSASLVGSEMCIRDSPSTSGPPGDEAPGEVGVRVRPDCLPGVLPGEVMRRSWAPGKISSQPEERGP